MTDEHVCQLPPLDTHAKHYESQSLAIPLEFLLTGMHLNELLWYGLADKQVFAPSIPPLIHRKTAEEGSANFSTLACSAGQRACI